MKKTVRIVLLCVCAAVFLFSAFNLLKTLNNYRKEAENSKTQQERFLETAARPAENAPAPETLAPRGAVTPPAETSAPSPAESASAGTAAPAETAAPAPETEGEETPFTYTPQDPDFAVNFEALRQHNPDVVGWLYCAGTQINYPVVKGEDNEYYLHRDLEGNELYSGTLFVDYRCSEIDRCRNYLIYGHSMKNYSMFGSLLLYKDPGYYRLHPYIWFITPDARYCLDLYAGFYVDATAGLYRPEFSASSLSGWLDYAKEHSTFRSAVEISPEENIVTFSTCAYGNETQRYVVLAKITKE